VDTIVVKMSSKAARLMGDARTAGGKVAEMMGEGMTPEQIKEMRKADEKERKAAEKRRRNSKKVDAAAEKQTTTRLTPEEAAQMVGHMPLASLTAAKLVSESPDDEAPVPGTGGRRGHRTESGNSIISVNDATYVPLGSNVLIN